MAATRPTAVNLFWAIDRLKRVFAAGAQAGESPEELAARLTREAQAIHDEDVANCRLMGGHGAEMVARRRARADALQRRCARHRGVRLRARA